jgi:predicted acetyltransferase
LVGAGPADGHALEHLYPLYLHDLTEFTDAYTVDEAGVFQPDHRPFWIVERPDTRRFLFRADGRLAGFALVGVAPFEYMSPDRNFRMVEFFVLRGMRRRGIGAACAARIFDRLPGTWEIAEVKGNAPAIRFWRHVVGQYTDGAFDEVTADGERIQRFCAGVAAGTARSAC